MAAITVNSFDLSGMSVDGVNLAAEVFALAPLLNEALDAGQLSYVDVMTGATLTLTGSIDGPVTNFSSALFERSGHALTVNGTFTAINATADFGGAVSSIVYQAPDGTQFTLAGALTLGGSASGAAIGGQINSIDTQGSATLTGSLAVITSGEITFGGVGGTFGGSTVVMVGNNSVAGSGGDDVLIGGTGNDTLNAAGGNDTVDGGAGKDVLIGGTGDDIFIVDLVRSAQATVLEDRLTELLNGGTDTLQLRPGAGYTLGTTLFTALLGANLENLDLALTGTLAINATGNALANTITGNAGANVLTGGLGVDVLIGGDGHDTYNVDQAAELPLLVENAGEGTDTLRILFATAAPQVISLSGSLANIENLVVVGGGLFGLVGNAASNTLIGNASANLLNGGAGADVMTGGAGNDIYIVDDVNDLIFDVSGSDEVVASVTYSLAGIGGVERLILDLGAGDIDGTGNALANIIAGSNGANVLTGLGGNDLYFAGIGDTVVEALNGGVDEVRASSSFALGDHIEKLLLLPTFGNINGTGNIRVNTITGNESDNILDGGGARDVLAGGLGNDTYIVDLIKPSTVPLLEDTITEAVTGGTDTLMVRASGGLTLARPFTLVLAANLENLDLSLTGSVANLNATGNIKANVITGNDAGNFILGLGGSDQLFGGGGDDMFVWDAADTAIDGGAGFDTLRVDGAGLSLDLAAMPVDGIEAINLTGSGNNTLTLTHTDLLAAAPGGTLRIDGNAGDVVDKGTGWTHGADQVIGAQTYRTFTQGGATLLVDTDILLPGPLNVPVGDSVALTGNAFIDGLTQGGSWQFPEQRIFTYSLNSNYEPPFPLMSWTPAMTAAIDRAFAAWSEVLDVDFVRVGSPQFHLDSPADLAISVGGAELAGLAGMGIFPDPELADLLLNEDLDDHEDRLTYPHPEGDVFFNITGANFLNLAPGGFGYFVMLHEIGHALGLKHPHDNGSNGQQMFSDLGIGTYDALKYTAMSYEEPIGFAYPSTPMALDIQALQHLYGANTSTRTGNDVYTLSNVLTTIWDAGGTDTLRAGSSFVPHTLDLRAGEFSGATGNLRFAIAQGVTIENATGGGGGDVLIGNDAANVLRGGGGSDSFTGGGGDDTFVIDALNRLVATIADYVQGEDVLGLGSVYAALFTAGDLKAGVLANGAPTLATERLVYNSGSGVLYYDANGSGAGAQTHVATLASGLTLTPDDFTLFT